MRLIQKLLVLSVVIPLLLSCAATPVTPIGGGDRDPTTAAAMASIELQDDYRLAPGDEIQINVFGEENLSGDFVVNSSGNITMPLVGQVAANGLTLPEFRDSLAEALSDGYLNDPRISVEVLNYRPIFILGEVSESGEYPYSEGLTVLNAVARAGGFTYRANTRHVFIKRQGADVEVQVPLTADLRVMPGDTIRIAERFF